MKNKIFNTALGIWQIHDEKGLICAEFFKEHDAAHWIANYGDSNDYRDWTCPTCGEHPESPRLTAVPAHPAVAAKLRDRQQTVTYLDPAGGWSIVLTKMPDSAAMISSDLGSERYRTDLSAASFDGLERLLLALTCAGVDVDSPEVRIAVHTAVEAIVNSYS